ncbi:unnamed protein product [Diatraea saccharalis]|uniref:C2H2-type domain-containing protein n=1 Tax=Diatraea saccharalis TaxID=40085 RepID=A0A9N9N462_9NEOP|nr:unnamed protein product [Diatraea saccharalis]
MRKRNESFSSKQFEIKNDLNCQCCGKEFKYESERKRHEQSHTPQFICKICNKKFSFMSALKRHEKQHERTGSVSCDHCNRKFRDESLLKRHIKYAHKGTFVCNKCSAIFNSDLALHSHMKIHKPESERKYRCSFTGCSKTFNFAHHLKHHELTHTNTKQYFCNECGKENDNNDFLGNIDISTAITVTGLPINKYDLFPNNGDGFLPDAEFVKFDNNHATDWKVQYLKDENEYSDIEVPKDLCQSENEELTILQKVNSLELNEDETVGDCKSSIGGCIVEDGNSHHKCLCVQMQSNAISIEDTYEFIANKSCNSVNSEPKNGDLKAVKVTSCDGCECSDHLVFKNKDESDVVGTINQINEIIDYKSDGTIKLKQTSDMDVQHTLPSSSSDSIINVSASENIPFNSCKDILGKCIVSGNGTISEGCLCAKMVMDDQQILDQEVIELTPCPKA